MALAGLTVGDRPAGAKPTEVEPETGPSGFAVIELFTSQGCSSCPPADRVLAHWANEPGVHALSLHVDYWDRLGWEDPFGSPEASQRQRRYARVLGDTVYTPQLVVNGRWVGVGSRHRTVGAAIREALERPAEARLSLAASESDEPRTIRVAASAEGTRRGDVLVLALVLSATENHVERGENSGRRLSHANVVLSLQQVGLGREAQPTVDVTLPEGVERSALRLIGFVQDARKLTIRAGDSVEVGSKE